MTSYHYNAERYYREMLILNCLGGDGKVIDSFIVDKGHPNGAERHDITDNGVIVVYNVRTKVQVTKLIARPGQVKRYYQNTNKRPPRSLTNLCEEHKRLGYCYI